METTAKTLLSLLTDTEGRKPTARQIAAVENYVANSRRGKAQALREAGYGQSTARHPARVFGSPTIQKVLEKMGLHDESEAIFTVKRNLRAKHPVNYVFPPFTQINEDEIALKAMLGEEDENTGEDFGVRLTDNQIRDYLKEGGITISKVVHGDRSRRFYGYADDPTVQLNAADMLLKVFGAYAPDKIIGKHSMAVGIMSMSELREKMKEEGMKIIDPLRK